jgi:hypothetical protein
MNLPVLERDLDLDLLLVRLLIDLLLVRLLIDLLLVRLLVARELLLLLGCLSKEKLELPEEERDLAEEERGLVRLPTSTSDTTGSGVLFPLEVFRNSLNKLRISLSCKSNLNCSSSSKQICTDCS